MLYYYQIGIECLTLYSFSMQNWKRPAEEVEFLMYLYSRYLEEIRPKLMENNVRLLHLGRTERLPQNVTTALQQTMQKTGDNTGMTLGLALNYDARTEITDAVVKIAGLCKDGKLSLDDIDQDDWGAFEDCATGPDVELDPENPGTWPAGCEGV